jgi:acetolactate synthase-like protein
VVILLGTVADFRMEYGRSLPKNVPIVAVNRCKVDLTKNSPLFWKPELAAHADPCSFLVQLGAQVLCGVRRSAACCCC